MDRLRARGRPAALRRHLQDSRRRDAQRRTCLRSCTDPCKADYTPFWSPDGTLISFTRFFSTCFQPGKCSFTPVFVMRADGTDLQHVTQVGTTPDQLGYEDYSPIWSPDGKRFAFQRYDPHKDKHAIFSVRLDGTGLRRITPRNRDAAEPDWSPDGRWIAFRTHEESDEVGDIGLVHPNGRGLHLVTSGRGKWVSCSSSPNGKKIVGAWPSDNACRPNCLTVPLTVGPLERIHERPGAGESRAWGCPMSLRKLCLEKGDGAFTRV